MGKVLAFEAGQRKAKFHFRCGRPVNGSQPFSSCPYLSQQAVPRPSELSSWPSCLSSPRRWPPLSRSSEWRRRCHLGADDLDKTGMFLMRNNGRGSVGGGILDGGGPIRWFRCFANNRECSYQDGNEAGIGIITGLVDSSWLAAFRIDELHHSLPSCCWLMALVEKTHEFSLVSACDCLCCLLGGGGREESLCYVALKLR